MERPIGFACWGPAVSSKTDWPRSIETKSKPTSFAMGGGGVSPRMTPRMSSRCLVVFGPWIARAVFIVVLLVFP